MTDFSQALAAILVSTDDGVTWHPLKQDEVPEWVKDPDVMFNLLHGEMAQQPTGIVSQDGVRPWYRAEKLEATGETKQ